jgi:hypothetical protein
MSSNTAGFIDKIAAENYSKGKTAALITWQTLYTGVQ